MFCGQVFLNNCKFLTLVPLISFILGWRPKSLSGSAAPLQTTPALWDHHGTPAQNILPMASTIQQSKDPSLGFSSALSPALASSLAVSKAVCVSSSSHSVLENISGIGRILFLFVVLPSINFLVVVHYSWIIKSELLIQQLIFKCSEEERTISQGIIYYKTF